MSEVTVEPCPLEWQLSLAVKIDAARFPDKDAYPARKIKISIGESPDGRGTTLFHYARLRTDGS